MTLLMQPGEHNIEDELVFTNYKGHIFHESSGFESGGETELKAVQDFVRRKSREGRLNDALHAIWSAPFPICIYNCKFIGFPFQVLRSDGQSSARLRLETF
jgi:hypothetical protein